MIIVEICMFLKRTCFLLIVNLPYDALKHLRYQINFATISKTNFEIAKISLFSRRLRLTEVNMKACQIYNYTTEAEEGIN